MTTNEITRRLFIIALRNSCRLYGLSYKNRLITDLTFIFTDEAISGSEQPKLVAFFGANEVFIMAPHAAVLSLGGVRPSGHAAQCSIGGASEQAGLT